MRAPPSSEALAWATVAWRKHLGEAHVLVDREWIKPAQTATFKTAAKVSVILRPANAGEVAACLRVATAHEVPIQPVSRGARWGYGSRAPAVRGTALLDLSRMDAIVDVDLALGAITVEPGVTFDAVDQRLRGTGWMLPGPGSTPFASVVGNAADGGVCDGLEPLRRRAVLELELVLPDGERVQTGMGAFPESLARGAFPGVGPDLTGLFLGGNLGVITRMTIALQPVPPTHCAVHFGIRDPARLPTLIEALRHLSRDGLLDGSVTLFNDYRLLAMSTRYPFAETNGATPLPEAWLEDVREAFGGETWIGEAAIRSTGPERLERTRATLEYALTPLVDHLTFAVDGASSHFTAGLGTSIETAYWRKRVIPDTPDRHPDRDRCGVIWFAPALPFRGDVLDEAVQTVAPLLLERGFEPTISIRSVDARAVILLVGLLFDREAPGEDEAALACHDALLALGARHGWVPHRPGLRGLPADTPVDRGAAALMKRLKAALDPADVLAPGSGDLRAFWR